jgi:iron(III) transport system permease protein
MSTVLERSTYLASSVPGVVVGLALVTVSIRYTKPIYQSAGVLIAAYVMLFLPRAVVSLRSGLTQARPGLEEASRSLGLGPIATFRRVTLPLSAPGIGAGMALVFLAVTTELTATLLLAPTGTHTLATQFWAYTSEIDYPTAAPYAALMIVLSSPITYLLLQQSRKAISG